MLDSVPDSLLNLAPGWVWILTALLLGLIIWESGNDSSDRNQDPVERIFVGLFLVLRNILNLAIWLIEVAIEAAAVILEVVLTALARVGRWAEENVSVEIVLDGTFWRLVIVIFLIGAGYLTITSLGF